MKKEKTKPQSKTLVPEVVEPTALTVKTSRMPAIKGKTPGQRINFLHRLSVASGKLSIAAGIMAGWELRMVKDKLEHGQWLEWLAANTAISPATAQRYMSVYSQTIGAARAALPEPVPLETRPSLAELNEAAANVDAPTLNSLYKQLKILKGNPDHGGSRVEQAAKNGHRVGRKAKGEEGGVEAAEEMVELDKVAETHSGAWSIVSNHLRSLQDAQREHHVFDRLEVVELAEANSILKALCKDVEAALQRFDNI